MVNAAMSIRFPALMYVIFLFLMFYVEGATLTIFFGVGSMIWGIDLSKRFVEFKKHKEELKSISSTRLVRYTNRYKVSMCQRHALIAAANHVGCKKKVKDLLYLMGYRWYHIFPDEPLWSIKFWKGFFKC